MSIDEAVSLMGFTETLLDGTPWSVFRVRLLTETLISDPESYWELYFGTADPASHVEKITNGMRLLAEVGENGTHGDLRFIADLERRESQQ